VEFGAAKGECGLGQYEVRRRRSDRVRITLALLAVLKVQAKKQLKVHCHSAFKRSAGYCGG
jgi:hypothetical protein